MFKKLKERFTKEPVLAVLDLDKKMRMEVDVLDYATGIVRIEDSRLHFLFSIFYFLFYFTFTFTF